jgi:hypothetical protein
VSRDAGSSSRPGSPEAAAPAPLFAGLAQRTEHACSRPEPLRARPDPAPPALGRKRRHARPPSSLRRGSPMTLTDAHLVLLSAAAQHPDQLLTRPERLAGDAAQKVAAKLVKACLAEEVSVQFLTIARAVDRRTLTVLREPRTRRRGLPNQSRTLPTMLPRLDASASSRSTIALGLHACPTSGRFRCTDRAPPATRASCALGGSRHRARWPGCA